MDQTIYLVTLVATALVLAAAFSSLIAFRFGAPLLLLFLAIGLLTGTDGLGIEFDNGPLAYFAGALALAVILFDSGFGTSLSVLRQAALPALSLATIGVALTTLIFGAAAFYLTNLSWLESFLLGAAVASTDAAAVFFLLRAGNLSLRERVRSTLEIESGTNDPIAIFLTITLVEVISIGAVPDTKVLLLNIVIGFIKHMGLGAIAGVLGGMAIVRLVDRLNLDSGLLPIFVLTVSLLIFAGAGAIGGSGFLSGLSCRAHRGQFANPGDQHAEAFSGWHVLAGPDHHVPGARPVRDAVGIHPRSRPGDPAGPFPGVLRTAGGGVFLPAAVPHAARRDSVHLLGGPARSRVDTARADAADRRA